MYKTAKGPRNAFPDGLMLLSDRTVIFEIKSQHMPEAWWQLRRHYQFVMEQYRHQPVQVIEVVKDFDLQIPFPEKVEIFPISQLTGVLLCDPKRFMVLQWQK